MTSPHPNFFYEKTLWDQSYTCVIGVDEVGRGCLAGPVVAGAVMFSPNTTIIDGVNDSKKLSAQQRLQLVGLIRSQANAWAVGQATVNEINTIGIVSATFLAMQRALASISTIDAVLVDGSLTPQFTTVKPKHIQTIIKGDQLSYSIAAASIIAKVYRDALMHQLALHFPLYGWAKNVGYGTKIHREAITHYGLTAHHRTLFCRKVMAATKGV